MKSRALECQFLSDDMSGVCLVERTISDPSEKEILIAIKASSVNFPDYLMTQGKYQHKPELPFGLGMEGSGIVKKTGKTRRIGDVIHGDDAVDLYYGSLYSGSPKVTYGAKWFSDGSHWLPDNNEYGPQQYAHFFFFVTGFHGFHVFSGVIINIIILIGVMRGIYHKRGHYEMVEKTGLYWHFVDLVWVFVFTFFYLI